MKFGFGTEEKEKAGAWGWVTALTSFGETKTEPLQSCAALPAFRVNEPYRQVSKSLVTGVEEIRTCYRCMNTHTQRAQEMQS